MLCHYGIIKRNNPAGPDEHEEQFKHAHRGLGLGKQQLLLLF